MTCAPETGTFLATAPEAAAVTGGYFAKSTPAVPSSLARDEALARRLWDLSAELAGVAPAT